MQKYYFRARIDQMVSGMDDTALVVAMAESFEEAADAAIEQHLGQDDYYKFTEEAWEGNLIGEHERRPSTGPVHYLGTQKDMDEMGDGPVMLTDVEGEKVTADHFE